MLGARDAEALLAHARAQGAHLVLVGDVHQCGSVEAGCAFDQFQDQGMATFRLEEIVLGSHLRTKAALGAMLDGDAKTAFEALDVGDGRVVEQFGTQPARPSSTVTSPRCPATSARGPQWSTPPAKAGRR